MPDYFHSALRGPQLHEAKIRVLPAGSSFPVPDWEGQLLVIGLGLYISIYQDNTLIWIQPKATNIPQLPSNVVIFEQGYGVPTPRSSSLSGIIYTNLGNSENYYLSLGQWLKLGPDLTSNKLFIQNSSEYNLQIPTDGTINAALLRTWEPGRSYYFKFEAPPTFSLDVNATTNYFVELKYSDTLVGSDIVGDSLLVLNTNGLMLVDDVYKIMVYFKGVNNEPVYCNFYFDLESRLVQVQDIATIYYDN